MRIITGSTGTTHVTSNDDGEFNQELFGKDLIVFENGNKLAASIVDNNTIRVLDGDLIYQGRHALITPGTVEDVAIETGNVGKNRNDLIVARYEMDPSTGFESITLEVLKGKETEGNAVDPEVTTGDIRTGALLSEVPLYRVKINGINIVELQTLFDTTTNFYEDIQELKKNTDALMKSDKNKSDMYKVMTGNDLVALESLANIISAIPNGCIVKIFDTNSSDNRTFLKNLGLMPWTDASFITIEKRNDNYLTLEVVKYGSDSRKAINSIVNGTVRNWRELTKTVLYTIPKIKLLGGVIPEIPITLSDYPPLQEVELCAVDSTGKIYNNPARISLSDLKNGCTLSVSTNDARSGYCRLSYSETRASFYVEANNDTYATIRLLS